MISHPEKKNTVASAKKVLLYFLGIYEKKKKVKYQSYRYHMQIKTLGTIVGQIEGVHVRESHTFDVSSLFIL